MTVNEKPLLEYIKEEANRKSVAISPLIVTGKGEVASDFLAWAWEIEDNLYNVLYEKSLVDAIIDIDFDGASAYEGAKEAVAKYLVKLVNDVGCSVSSANSWCSSESRKMNCRLWYHIRNILYENGWRASNYLKNNIEDGGNEK